MLKKAYAGIRIVDFTHVLSGPFCTYQFALLGADVIKIEEPGLGDYMRRRGSDPDLRRQLIGDHFLSLNANKRSIVVDLETDGGVNVARRLMLKADVVVENFRAGVMERLGLGYETIAAENPGLVYCALSGFGRAGPDARRKVYDQVAQASSGMMSGNGEVGGAPLKTGSPVVDYSSGMMAAFAIASALFDRASTGRGRLIDVAMHDAALMLMSTGIMNQLRGGKPPKPHGNEHPLAAASGYRASDGEWIMLGCCTQAQFERLCALLERPDIAADPRFADVNRQDAHRAELAALLGSIMATRTAQEWETLLSDHVPAARMKTLAEGLELARVNERNVVQTIADPKGTAGQAQVPVAAYSFGDGGGPAITSFPPRLGEHTKQVLAEAGFDDGEISCLLDDGSVETWSADRMLPL